MNFLSKASSIITEAISGEKTNDKEYQTLCLKMSKIESGINSLKGVLKGYQTYSEPFCKYLKLLNDSINRIYKNSPLKIEVNEIILKHELILKDIANLGKLISKLYSKTSEWDTIFDKAKKSIKVREEKRMNFDHYEQKLLKIEEDKEKKKIIEFVNRNIVKYKAASKEYIDASEKSFKYIKNSIKLSWELANPILGELIIYEKDIFAKINSYLINFENISFILNEIMNQEFNQDINKNKNKNNISYDPKKYIKSKLLNNKKENEYKHIFIRKTNTFGKVPLDREKRFFNIKENILNDDN